MGSVGADEAAAAPGLRTAVDFYTAKSERLRRRQADLEAELASLRVELVKADSARDQLAEALAEIAGRDAGSAQDREPSATGSAKAAQDDEAGPADRPGRQAGTDQVAARRKSPVPGDGQAASAVKSGEVMQAILQILATSGRPLGVRDITEALGRPVSGAEGRVVKETTRSTCKRLVKTGRVVEGPVGVFAIARPEGPHAEGAA
ncbi:hypothetical protein OG689_41955 [Kitasatospora sp. NBC_00240]|uniref:hypothetical protein n=1 Tax=Kitasatospora sp. NBC_00240 TaxID=2903567 RepID=UPI0022550A0E|nr:hypothetical protein [Kitasatospora sp. NBC_00240]MCX5211153.1 hypothetical protein [Kitasatospora sp. NBC_00240]MCX5215724.1 hypothetical protein [Kitasatospora sp. NBC_00240]